MQAKYLVVAVLLLSVATVLASCDFSASGSQTAPSPQATEPGSTATPGEGEVPDNTRLAVTVGEEPFTLSDLTALPQVQISAAGQTYQGVSILELLSTAQVTDVMSITLVARDAITVELEVPGLSPESILAFGPGEILNAVLPDQQPEEWLQDVVVIDVPPGAQVVLRVGQDRFSLTRLQSMERVTVEVDGDTYEGVRILDLLAAAGLDGPTILLQDREGATVEIPVAELKPESILALSSDDSLQAVLPGLADSYWLADVVEIRAP